MRIIKTLGYGVAVVAVALVQAISPAMSAYATAAAVANPTETTSAPAPVTTPQVEAKVATCTDNTFDMTLSNDAGTQDYTVWTKLKLDFTGAIPDGMTTYTKTAILPPELSGNAATYNLYAPDGTTVMGHMVSDGHTVTFTFDAAYISTHNCITWNATLYAGFATTVDPGTPYNLEFLLDGTTKTFPITIGECPYCNTLYTGPDKWAVVADDTHTVVSGIHSHVTIADNETITITDVVDSHQTLRCDDISVFQQGNMLDNRGSLVREADVTADATITCSAHTVTMVLAKTLAHKVYTLYVLATADGTLPAYVDTATIIQGGVTYKQNATATVYGGGGGNGTQLIPEIAIEKWDTDRTTGAHDSADDAKKLDAHTDQLIHFTITNTGNEMLKNIIVSDETDTDSVALLNVTCDFSHLGGPATGLVWDGPFAPGDHFDCAGTLPALGYDAVHADRAHVSAIGFTSEKPVSDQNDWYGYTDEAPVTPPTPVMPPVTPVVPVTPGRGNVTVPTLPVVPNELPQTGPSTSLPVWLPLAAGTLTYAVLLRIRRRA